MSSEILWEPGKDHELQDDFQSFFWVLLWACIRYLPSSIPDADIAGTLFEIFDRYTRSSHGTTGGVKKRTIIQFGLVEIDRFFVLHNNPAAHDFLHNFCVNIQRWLNCSGRRPVMVERVRTGGQGPKDVQGEKKEDVDEAGNDVSNSITDHNRGKVNEAECQQTQLDSQALHYSKHIMRLFKTLLEERDDAWSPAIPTDRLRKPIPTVTDIGEERKPTTSTRSASKRKAVDDPLVPPTEQRTSQRTKFLPKSPYDQTGTDDEGNSKGKKSM